MASNIQRCCCVGHTCDDCPGVHCTSCTADAGKTPDSWIVTIAGFGDCDGHCVFSSGSYEIFGNINGTWTVLQATDPCTWTKETPTSGLAISGNAWSSSDCSGTPTAYPTLRINVFVSGLHNRFVEATLRSESALPDATIIFSSHASSDCCSTISWSASSYSDCNASGGIITLTPCG